MLDKLREMLNTQRLEEARQRKMQGGGDAMQRRREKITSIERRRDGRVNEDMDDKSPK
jgi:hypothetical protein